MFDKDFFTPCRTVCLAVAAVSGLLTVLALSSAGSLFPSILVGIVLGALVAAVLIRLVCEGGMTALMEGVDIGPETDTKTSDGPAAAGHSAAAMAAAGAGAASAGGDSSVKEGEAARQAVKSGTLLKGEQEVAESAGSWSYGSDDRAAKAATKKPEDLDKMDDSAHLFVSEDADAEAGAQVSPTKDDGGGAQGETMGKQPEALSGPRGGKADNLKEIKGVGPKLEIMLNEMGFYHFDQIANWSPEEEAWVDANLKRFKGRASRDEWIKQASILAEGGDTEFSKRVDKGDVY